MTPGRNATPRVADACVAPRTSSVDGEGRATVFRDSSNLLVDVHGSDVACPPRSSDGGGGGDAPAPQGRSNAEAGAKTAKRKEARPNNAPAGSVAKKSRHDDTGVKATPSKPADGSGADGKTGKAAMDRLSNCPAKGAIANVNSSASVASSETKQPPTRHPSGDGPFGALALVSVPVTGDHDSLNAILSGICSAAVAMAQTRLFDRGTNDYVGDYDADEKAHRIYDGAILGRYSSLSEMPPTFVNIDLPESARGISRKHMEIVKIEGLSPPGEPTVTVKALSKNGAQLFCKRNGKWEDLVLGREEEGAISVGDVIRFHTTTDDRELETNRFFYYCVVGLVCADHGSGSGETSDGPNSTAKATGPAKFSPNDASSGGRKWDCADLADGLEKEAGNEGSRKGTSHDSGGLAKSTNPITSGPSPGSGERLKSPPELAKHASATSAAATTPITPVGTSAKAPSAAATRSSASGMQGIEARGAGRVDREAAGGNLEERAKDACQTLEPSDATLNVGEFGEVEHSTFAKSPAGGIADEEESSRTFEGTGETGCFYPLSATPFPLKGGRLDGSGAESGSDNVDALLRYYNATGCLSQKEEECLRRCLACHEKWGLACKQLDPERARALAKDLLKVFRGAVLECVKPNPSKEEEGLHWIYIITQLVETFLLSAQPSGEDSGGSVAGSLTADAVRCLGSHIAMAAGWSLHSHGSGMEVDLMLKSDQPESYQPASASSRVPGPFEESYWNLILRLVLHGRLGDAWTALSHHSEYIRIRMKHEPLVGSLTPEEQGFEALRAILLSAPLPGGRGDEYFDDDSLNDYLEELEVKEGNGLDGEDRGGAKEEITRLLRRGFVPFNAYLLWERLPRRADTLRGARHRRDGQADNADAIGGQLPMTYQRYVASEARDAWKRNVKSTLFPSGVEAEDNGVLTALFERYPPLKQICLVLLGNNQNIPDAIVNDRSLAWNERLLMQLIYCSPETLPAYIARLAVDAMSKAGCQKRTFEKIVLDAMQGSAEHALDMLKSDLCSDDTLSAVMASLLSNVLVNTNCISPDDLADEGGDANDDELAQDEVESGAEINPAPAEVRIPDHVQQHQPMPSPRSSLGSSSSDSAGWQAMMAIKKQNEPRSSIDSIDSDELLEMRPFKNN